MRGQRSIKQITETIEPKDVYRMITKYKGTIYSRQNQPSFTCEDHAFLAISYLTGGRVTEVCGGLHREVNRKTGQEERLPIDHQGLQRENITITDKWIEIRNMPVVKRNQKTIKKHGLQTTQRPPLIYPLTEGVFRNQYYNQYIPFTWLVVEYLTRYAPEEGKLFRFKSNRAWRICNYYTDQHPHWFRAQAERFHINYIEQNSILHARYMRRLDIDSMANYVDYDYTKEFSENIRTMDFKWIDSAVAEIKARIKL